MGKRIPISAAKEIAKKYGYDQVMIYARDPEGDGNEWMTTYGKNRLHCDIAARQGRYLQTKIMGWHKNPDEETKNEKE